MTTIRSRIAKAIPWLEPVLEYFDWRKRLVALFAAAIIAGWSYVKDLPWPTIIVLAALMLVTVAYALVFPAFLKIINLGAHPHPNHSIWKHKKQFQLFEAACLLGEQEPTNNFTIMSGDAKAWFAGLKESIRLNEIQYVPGLDDGRHTYQDGYHPHQFTVIDRAELKKYCTARGRKPEFLN
jgi:hypothetical protein